MTHKLRRSFTPRLFAAPLLLALIAVSFLATMPARAANRDKIAAFLNVTGFDVALDSIRFSASAAPEMLGIDASAFGSEWKRLADSVFDTDHMRTIALDILEQTLSEDNLNYAVEFYAGDLGQRLVSAENETHMLEDDTEKKSEGTRIVSDLVAEGSPRVELFKRMNRAIDVDGAGVRALEEIQMRFLLTASAAGVIELNMDADELRAVIRSQESDTRIALQRSALASSAFTYKDFSDADLDTYVEALETPQMKEVYELLNAVQYQIMADRFSILASRMADLQPGEDI